MRDATTWASVAPLLERWQMALIPHDDLTWDVFSGYTPHHRLPIHDARRVPFSGLPQAIWEVSQRCEATLRAVPVEEGERCR